jgi:hypothetical protein
MALVSPSPGNVLDRGEGEDPLEVGRGIREISGVLASCVVPGRDPGQRHTGIALIRFEEIVEQVGGVDLRPKPRRDKQRQELEASDVQDSLARLNVKVLQDVSRLGTTDVLDH